MSEQLLEKNITVAEVKLEDKKISLIDTDKKKYSIWKTKQDGNPTKAFESFQNYVMSATGKHFNIKYNEKPVADKPNAFYRTIVIISEINENTTAKPVSYGSTSPKTAFTGDSGLETRITALEVRISKLEALNANPSLKNEEPLTAEDLAAIPF